MHLRRNPILLLVLALLTGIGVQALAQSADESEIRKADTA